MDPDTARRLSSGSYGSRFSLDDLRSQKRGTFTGFTSNAAQRHLSMIAKNLSISASSNAGTASGAALGTALEEGLSEGRTSPLFAAVMHYLSYAHPLLTARPASVRD